MSPSIKAHKHSNAYNDGGELSVSITEVDGVALGEKMLVYSIVFG